MSLASEILEQELEKRCRKNPKYSLRAFAKALNLNPSSLSLVLSGKRNLSKKKATEIAEILAFPPKKRKLIIDSATDRKKINSNPHSSKNKTQYNKISHDQFHLVADWYHYAILSLLEIKNSKLDPKWISKKLNISETCASLAIKRLLRMNLIRESNGCWKQSDNPITIDRSITSAATKKFQKQLLNKAIYSLENDLYEERDHTSMTMAISEKSLPFAQKRIKEFRRSLTKELENQSEPDRVYNLTIQFYPISEKS